MFHFEIEKDRFTILNLSDMQLNEYHYDPEDPRYNNSLAVFDYTVRELIARVKPDLITITGDLSMADQPKAYPQLADYIDAFGIPWCAVWGNHEQQDVEKRVNFVYEFLPYYRSRKHFFHEDGDPEMGNGNYLISIEKGGKPVHTLFMIDSHNCVWLPDENGVKQFYYDKLTEKQLAWYKEQAAAVKAQGCMHSTMMMHIPIYAHWEAWDAALKADVDPCKVTLAESYAGDCWNEGFEGAYGVGWGGRENAYPYDDGVFDAIQEIGITDSVIAGHVHLHNTVIPYKGVRLAFTLKTGKVHPWMPPLNGGTVITVHPDGHSDLCHEYVDVTHLMNRYDCV